MLMKKAARKSIKIAWKKFVTISTSSLYITVAAKSPELTIVLSVSVAVPNAVEVAVCGMELRKAARLGSSKLGKNSWR